jgi:hypothetical protein
LSVVYDTARQGTVVSMMLGPEEEGNYWRQAKCRLHIMLPSDLESPIPFLEWWRCERGDSEFF